MSGKRITSGETPTAIRACVGAFASMEFGMALQIMQSSKSRLALLTFKWLLLAMSKQMALEIVMSSELRGAVWALMFSRA